MVAVRNTTTSYHYLHRPNIEAIHNLAGICNGFQYCHIASVKHWLTCSNDEFLFLQAKIGRKKECEAALQNLRGEIADISQETTKIKEMF